MHFSSVQLFATCVLIWGSTWLAITFQFGTVAPELSVGYRFLLASAVLFAFCRWRRLRLTFTFAEHREFFLFGTITFCLSYMLIYYAETLIVSGMVAIGYSASPLVNMLMSRLIFATPMTRSVAVGALLGLVGIVCVFWPEFGMISASRNAELGAVVTVLSVLASCAGNMAGMRIQRRGDNVWSSMGWGMLYGGALSVLVAAFSGKPIVFDTSVQYILSLIYLALLGSIVTFACFLTLMKRHGAARASFVGVMSPIAALALSFFFENFAWGWMTTIGVALSVLGNIVIMKSRKDELAH